MKKEAAAVVKHNSSYIVSSQEKTSELGQTSKYLAIFYFPLSARLIRFPQKCTFNLVPPFSTIEAKFPVIVVGRSKVLQNRPWVWLKPNRFLLLLLPLPLLFSCPIHCLLGLHFTTQELNKKNVARSNSSYGHHSSNLVARAAPKQFCHQENIKNHERLGKKRTWYPLVPIHTIER